MWQSVKGRRAVRRIQVFPAKEGPMCCVSQSAGMLIHVRLLNQSNFWLTSCYGACVLLANQLILKTIQLALWFLQSSLPQPLRIGSLKVGVWKQVKNFPKPFLQKAWCPFRGCKVVKLWGTSGIWSRVLQVILVEAGWRWSPWSQPPQTYSFRSNLSKIFFWRVQKFHQQTTEEVQQYGMIRMIMYDHMYCILWI